MRTASPDQRLLDVITGRTQSATVTVRLNAEDAKVLVALSQGGESVSDILRRGMRRVAQEQWEEQLRVDAARLSGEDLNSEADAW